MLKLPKGTSDFKSIVDEKYFIIDKTLFIKELIDDPSRIILIPRPRRFGKTTNMSMLRYFFDCVGAEENKRLFKALNISRSGDEYLAHQGQYPVVFITLKEASATNFAETMLILQHLMQKCFGSHRYLSSSEKLAPEEKNFFQKILEGNANTVDLKQSLVFLTHALQKHHQRPVVLIIDEYDAPMHASFSSENPYINEMTDFMRGFLGAALKDNNALHKAVVTGILQVAQASLFSGLNNIRICNILDAAYSDCFGFTQSEVDTLFEKAQLSYNREEIKEWYNGYCIGGHTTVYNPWSIISCILEKGQVGTYWLETGNYGLIGSAFEAHSSLELKRDLETLIRGDKILKKIDTSIVLTDLATNKSSLWAVLFFAGYLRADEIHGVRSGLATCSFSIPNREITSVFERFHLRLIDNGLRRDSGEELQADWRPVIASGAC